MSNQARKNQEENKANNVVSLGDVGKGFVEFKSLVLGDRFQPLHLVGEDQPVFTKTRHDQARLHTLESTALGEKGHGYQEDPIVAVPSNEKVKFIPV